MTRKRVIYPLMGIVIADDAFVDKILQTRSYKANSLTTKELPRITVKAQKQYATKIQFLHLCT